MRVILPGALATAVIYPFVGWRTDFLSAEFGDVWRELLVIVIVVCVLGILIAAVSGEIYKIYEGRILWPGFLFDWLRKRQTRKIKALVKAADKNQGKHNRYNEIWNRLRMYPIDEKGEPTATHPTLLGNVLAGYEDYPFTRHGMDSVFFWPRLWLTIGKEVKEEIDGPWSIADGFLSMSAVSFVGGTIWLMAVAIPNLFQLNFPIPFGSFLGSGSVGLLLLVFGYCLYRLSLPFHRNNGEVFKALFDLYRENLVPMTKIGPDEMAVWKGTWSYLQYLRVFCVNCQIYFPVHEGACKVCKRPTTELLKQLSETFSQ
jgi:hypothetical protein